MLQRVDLGEIDYLDAIDAMAGWTAQRRAGTVGDRLFLLSHPDVITYGPRTDLADLPDEMAGLPRVAVDRGGFARVPHYNVNMAPAAAVTGVDFALEPEAVLTGRVLDALASVSVLLNRSFFVLDAFIVGSRRVLNVSRQHHGIAAGIDEGSEVHQNFSPAFDSSSTLYVGDPSLHVCPSRNQDTIIQHHGKSGLRVH